MRHTAGLCFAFTSVIVFLTSGLTAQSVKSGPPSVDARQTQEWVGTRTAGERSQDIVLHVESGTQARGTVDLPNFGALGTPAAEFAMASGKLHFELVGDTSAAVFDGVLVQGGYWEHWQEGERSGDFRLQSSRETAPQWQAREIAFQNGDVRLSGTFMLPKGTKPSGAVVFVHGAGPETRQASLFLAHHFAERNVAALIYDKRGTGRSTGDWRHASFENLASDVEAAVQFLKSQPQIDPRRIGLMGSSQGGWIAPMAASHLPDLAFVIVKSAAAVSPERQELVRVEVQMRARELCTTVVSPGS